MNFPFYIAKRYALTKTENNTINQISKIASYGVIVVSMALIIVMSVFSGLKEYTLNLTNAFDSDLKITPVKGKFFEITKEKQMLLESLSNYGGHSLILEEKAFLHFRERDKIVILKGVDSNYVKYKKTDTLIRIGNWFDPNYNQLVLGENIAYNLSIGIEGNGNIIEIYVPKPGRGSVSVSNINSFVNKINAIPVGTFELNSEYTSKYAFAPLHLVRNLLSKNKNSVSSIDFHLNSENDEKEVMNKLTSVFPKEKFKILNKQEQNVALYRMLNTENATVYLIVTLILVIAMFNIIGSIIMMILEKRKNIITLYNIGTNIKDIRKIFMFQGVILTIFGGILGMFIGVIIVLLQLKFGFIKINEGFPYPVKLEWFNVILTLFTIIVFGFIASRIASSRVTKSFLSK